MDQHPHQNPINGDHSQPDDSAGPLPPSEPPKVPSAPPLESAQTVISGGFFAGAHRFSINGGSFYNSEGDINQNIVYDHSYRSNFGNRYGDNYSNSTNKTSHNNAGYNDNRRYRSNQWTQASSRTQYYYDETLAPRRGPSQGGRSSAPPNLQQPAPALPASAHSARDPYHRNPPIPLQVDAQITGENAYGPFDREEIEEPEPHYVFDSQNYPNYRLERDSCYEQMYHGEQQERSPDSGRGESGLSGIPPRHQFKSNNPFAGMLSPQ